MMRLPQRHRKKLNKKDNPNDLLLVGRIFLHSYRWIFVMFSCERVLVQQRIWPDCILRVETLVKFTTLAGRRKRQKFVASIETLKLVGYTEEGFFVLNGHKPAPSNFLLFICFFSILKIVHFYQIVSKGKPTFLHITGWSACLCLLAK